MDYVTHLNIFGVEAKEIPCITGNGVPTKETPGAVGTLYMNIDTGLIYKCVSSTDDSYTWKYSDNLLSDSLNLTVTEQNKIKTVLNIPTIEEIIEAVKAAIPDGEEIEF